MGSNANEGSASTLEAPAIAPRSPQKQRVLSKQQALKLAEQHEAAGRLQQAEVVLRSILKQHPNDSFATHLLGVVAHRVGKDDLAKQLIEQAISANPNVARFHSNICEMHRLSGNLEAAAKHGEEAVRLNPVAPETHSNLGIVYYDQKDYDKAEACQNKALEIEPNYPQAMNNIGSVHRARHDKSAAIDAYRKVIAANPEYTESLSNLGATLVEDERPEEALEHLARAIRINPNYAEAYCNLACANMALEKTDEAFINLRRALELRPEYPEALRGMAGLRQQENNLPEAEKLARRAIQLEPDLAKGHVLLGNIFKEQGFPDRARTSFSKALELDSELISAHLGMGHLEMEVGNMDAAEKAFLHALILDEDALGARLALAQVRKVKPDDYNMTALIEESKELESMHELKAMSLHFALGKCFDDTKQPKEAFQHYMEGCRLKRKRIDYDAAANEDNGRKISEYFSRERIESLRGAGNPSEVPIFVLGMPRSGTTLTEQILASHSQVFGAGELHDLLYLANNPFPARGKIHEGFPIALGDLKKAEVTALGNKYVKGLRERAPGSARITDKMPANCFCIGLIHLILPNAKIIHVKRNPVDTCVSQFTRLFNKSQYQSYDLAELGRFYKNYTKVMDHWRNVLPAGSFYEIQYEEVVADIDSEARKLLEYCGLEWEDGCLDFHKTERSVRTASVTQVRQPIYNSSVERWRKYEEFLGPLLKELGDLVPNS